ncbi:hypothetical protein VSS74_27260 [Conexibacter stalactiti]|uniref:Glyoxalase-like domain-containing protein n=1 Tax=Conexibacter stalactiti TaxID=1940611 RepID=A0ABU4I004_9ACTN|nr:hypothetical protein [Conexibacter stalactiti]MDW5598085.1 hypothetical protein [Conexibacter stalactiti]MEC5038727.1 hypothetical protein [Conexibacter stalactiti]
MALGWIIAAAIPALASAGSSTVQQTLAVTKLGTPDQLGYVVSDARAVQRQLAMATGSQFAPARAETTLVTFPQSGRVELVKLTRTQAVRGGPGLELIESSAKIGPFATDSGNSSFFYSYTVDNIALASVRFGLTGFDLVAFDLGRFAFWRSDDGILIRLLDRGQAPSVTAANAAQAPVDLGPPSGATIIPCDPQGALADLKRVLPDLGWRPSARYPMPFQFEDGTTPLIEMTVDASVESPFVVIESPMTGPARYGCTPDRPHAHLLWLTTDVAAAAQQLENAGMAWVSRVPGMVSLHRGEGGIFVEVANAAFLG